MAGYPLQRNQQPSIVIGGRTYTWNTDVGKYLDPGGFGLDGFKTYLLQPNQQPTVGEYKWDYSTGQYKNAKGEVMGAPGSTPLPITPIPHDETGLPPVPDPNKGQGNNPPTPPPPPDWRTQQSWWGSLFPTAVTQRAAYDLDPSFAWATATNKLGGNNWAPEYGWLASQQGRMHTLYGDENTRLAGTPEGSMTFSDWIEKNAPTFHQQFLQQPASQKGYTDYWMPAGRSTF